MEITYNPASLRPLKVTTLHGIRLQVHEGIPDGVIVATDDTGFVIVQDGVVDRVSFDAAREAWENAGTSAQHMATSVQHAATTMAEVMACFEESETDPE